ncbi:MAG TPA: hypothetical protein DCS17_10725 [Flavobacterium sp.]|jgi:Molybdenum cofactor biosynthesis enzyme|nr:hypothetical protein [Flavobacterium sp.]
MNTWRVLRVLLTNKCNLDCIYCHNEGQKKGRDDIDFSLLTYLIQNNNIWNFQKIFFSGGEPLTYKKINDIILFTHKNSNVDIGLVTNGIYLNNKLLETIELTHTHLIISLQSLEPAVYFEVTKQDKIEQLLNNIKLAKEKDIKITLNHVLYNDNDISYQKVIEYALETNIDVKLLPYYDAIGNRQKDVPSDLLNYLSKNSLDVIDTKKGRTEYILSSKSGTKINVSVLNSFCLTCNKLYCRNYSEIRLLPDFTLQPCICKPSFNENIQGELITKNIEKISQTLSQLYQRKYL